MDLGCQLNLAPRIQRARNCSELRGRDGSSRVPEICVVEQIEEFTAKLKRGSKLKDYLGVIAPRLRQVLLWSLISCGFCVLTDLILWLLGRPTVSSIVIGARNVAQLQDNLAAAEVTLSTEQVARLDRASAVRPAYPYWHQRQTFSKRNPPPV